MRTISTDMTRQIEEGAGCFLLLKERLPSIAITSNSNLEMVWATCKTSSSNLLIGVCYRPPDCGISFIHNLRSSISAAVDYCSPSDIYLFGDFNFPQIDWANLSSPSHAATEFINLTLDFYLFQVISQNSRGSNILDLVLTTTPETIG